MRPISDYFSPKLQRDFKRAVPTLRRMLGRVAFQDRDTQFGVSGETFRAFRDCSNRPSELYRCWAAGVCEKLSPQSLDGHLRSRQSFMAWHGALAEDLQAHWRKHEDKELSFAHQHKLVDLFVKWLSGHSFGLPTIPIGFAAHANCALDRQTLAKLNECLSYALPMPAPSMGHILSDRTYSYCQELIAEFTVHCGGTPLLFDYFAWKRGG